MTTREPEGVEDARRCEQTDEAREAREEQAFRAAIREALGDFRARDEAFVADDRATHWVADVIADALRVTRDDERKKG